MPIFDKPFQFDAEKVDEHRIISTVIGPTREHLYLDIDLQRERRARNLPRDRDGRIIRDSNPPAPLAEADSKPCPMCSATGTLELSPRSGYQNITCWTCSGRRRIKK